MKSPIFSSVFMLAIAVVLLADCSLAPNYKKPATEVPPAFKEAGDWATAQPADDAARGNWWKIFGDPQLNALEDKVTAANQNLKVALAQYQEARNAADAARADLFPTVTGSGSATRNKDSGNIVDRPGIKYFNDFSFGANMSYEVDLWGRVRNAVAAAKDEAAASKADLAGVDLSLHAELASDYFALRGDDTMQDVLDETVKIDQQAFDLVNDRLKGGIATETDLDQAQTELENAKTQAADTRLQRAQLEHAIAVLIGQPPASFSQDHVPLGDLAPAAVNPGLPSVLLERRPDIAAAERRAAAANAEIGVARAAWFPTFSLTGSIGYESQGTSTWLDAPSRFWSLGPSGVMTLFDAGRIDALSDEARAAYDEAAADYRQTVLNAYQEVEDNLVALHRLEEENKSQQAAASAAERSLTQEKNLYEGGAATYIDVAVAQNTALQAELALVNIRVRRMTADVQLIKALGGGWQADEKEPAKE
jgi:NodT family efflux transporter outer membrane factor (OMF) lipoprotein